MLKATLRDQIAMSVLVKAAGLVDHMSGEPHARLSSEELLELGKRAYSFADGVLKARGSSTFQEIITNACERGDFLRLSCRDDAGEEHVYKPSFDHFGNVYLEPVVSVTS